MFKKTVREARQEIKKREDWHAEIDGYDVIICHDDDLGGYSVLIYPNNWRQYGEPERLRLPLLSFHPKRVEEFDALAKLLPSVLTQVASGLRAEGLTDLRSQHDVWRDEMDAKMAQWKRGPSKAAKNQDPHGSA